MRKNNRVLPIIVAMTTVAGSLTGCGQHADTAATERVSAAAAVMVSLLKLPGLIIRFLSVRDGSAGVQPAFSCSFAAKYPG